MNSYKLKKYSVYVILTAIILLLPVVIIIAKTPEFNYGIPADRSKHPNIIIILADDVGYGDLGGYYGGKAKTPHLNSLAQEGMLFSDFHSNGPMCSPTRAALMTGRYQQRLGIERALPTDWDDRGIGSNENKSEITMAEYLSKAGYETGIFGKWHLGKHPSANPVNHGFDVFRGLTCGCGDYFSKIDRNGYRDWWHNDELSFQEGYTTEVITDNSINFIESHKDNPFFLYVAYNAIHFPWQTAEDYDLETRREGEDFTSSYPRKRSKLGPHSPEEIPAVLVRMTEELDSEIGRIIKKLREEGLDKETFIFFFSDNGGYLRYAGNTWPKVGSNGILRGQKGQVYEGGHRVPAIACWPGKIPALSVCDETVMSFDLLPTFLELLDISIPAEDNSNALDGVSLLPLLLRDQTVKSRPLFWRMGNQKSVRYEDWKLVISGKDSKPELYNLREDIGETNNLSSQFPQKVDQLKAELESWENDVNNKGN
jgi:arylsulfatase A